ncbi:MAG: hypothetical protein IPK26_25530 [Planctomycetes bacterium]|nr:hypothetical protein [Planctomycetota bacterium]
MRMLLASLVMTALAVQAQSWQVTSSFGFGSTAIHDPVRDRVVVLRTQAPPTAWEWDGQRWYDATVPGMPSSQYPPRAAFDTARGKIVMLLQGNTWYYDGRTWQLAATQGPWPTDQSTNSHAWDPIRQRLVYYFLGSVYEWDGVQWHTIPADLGWPLGWRAFGFDPVLGRVIATHFNGAWSAVMAWDGVAWVHIATAIVPAAMPIYGMAVHTDPLRNRLVLYGGALQGSGASGNLWEWDGNAWNLLATGPARRHPVVARHLGTGRLLISGGDDGANVQFDTWYYDGSFHLQSQSAQPCVTTMAVDPVRQRIVAVGCDDDRTWESDGLHWTQMAPAPAVTDLVFDPVQNQLLGIDNDISRPALRTWAWDGAAWTLRNSNGPGWMPRQGLCFDPLRQVVVAVGLQGTWEWNGSVWVARTPANAPAVHHAATTATAVFDAAVGRVRFITVGIAGAEEWEWDGTNWTRATTTGLPAAAYGKLVIDAIGNRVLYVASPANGPTATWARQGNAWVQIATGGTTVVSTIAPDPFHGQLKSYQQGTWASFGGELAAITRYGTGCGAGDVPTLSAVGRPVPVGSDVLLDATRCPAGAPAAIYASLTTANTLLGGGCTLLLGAPVHFAVAVTSTTGAASLALAVPLLPQLVGVDVFWQGVVLQTNGPLLGVAALTNGVRLHVGN